MQSVEFRITKSAFGILLYPTPVDKSFTYLIKVQSEFHAQIYKHLLDFDALKTPKTHPQFYELEGIHTDGKTLIFRVNEDELVLEYLPQREIDVEKAYILEQVMARKITRLLKSADCAETRAVVIKEILHRYSMQQECSECQRLGINSQELIRWFEKFSELS
jgi:hypothetical protein